MTIAHMSWTEKHRESSRSNHLGMAKRGAWRHLIAAAMLITVLPALILLWLYSNSPSAGDVSTSASVVAGVAWISLASLGYALLIKYPVSIVRLRSYLHNLAHDQLPDQVTLPQTEDDIAAIHKYLEHVVIMAAERLRLLGEKHEADLATERHRIMVESIGALCHHVGQPASVLGMQLHLMQQAVSEPETTAMVVACDNAFKDIMTTLDRLRQVTHYETEHYLATEPDGRQILRMPDDTRAPRQQDCFGVAPR